MSANYYILHSDALSELREWPENSFDCCVTSPPYWGLRDYHTEGQIGLGDTLEEYVKKLTATFREVRRTLVDDGTLWLVVGDSYARNAAQGQYKPASHFHVNKSKLIQRGSGRWGGGNCPAPEGVKQKDLIGIPWLLAFALRADGWYLRSDIIWAKPNPMPESVTDRPTRSHEYIFLFSKSERYYYDSTAIAESCISTDARKFTDNGVNKQRGHTRRHAGFNGRYAASVEANGAPKTRNKRDVWTVATSGYAGAHFAVFPPTIVTPCILAGCPPGGWVLDPFCGSGTTLRVAVEQRRNAVGIDINEDYCVLTADRMRGYSPRNGRVSVVRR